MSTVGTAPGHLEVRVDGERAHSAKVDAGGKGPLPYNIGTYPCIGADRVDVRLSRLSVPYALTASWTTVRCG